MASPRQEYVQIVGVPSPLPVAWLEGDVLAEYLQFLEEAEKAAAAAAPLPGVKWLEGDVLANFLQFLGEDEPEPEPEPVVHYDSGNGGDSMDEEEEDEEMAFLLRHITGLPAFMARAAAAATSPRCKID
ncbi:hypothetical protein ZWY2020_011900 [Hordeum vulgare]|uniref:Uncharacterized protein n=1 Tax=Hordeum vulgare subsp. vulgare TaxID=112509 RepID=A0A8I6WUY4_HORVV|nr:hypothetical protein ZWY2020_011900 [Hordeum vulgare]